MDGILNLKEGYTTHRYKLVEIEEVKRAVLEISPSKVTSNSNVKWLLTEFSRLYKPFTDRVHFQNGVFKITPEMDIWWEVYINKGHIKFYLVVPDKDNIKDSLIRQVMKTWKQANVREVSDYVPKFTPENTDITKLSLKHTPVLSLDYLQPQYSPLDSFLNAKHYLKDNDSALLQIGMKPIGDGWNTQAKESYDNIKKTNSVPRKKGSSITISEVFQKVAYAVGLVAEELINILGDFFIPGWEPDRTVADSMKSHYGSIDSDSTRRKVRDDSFATEIRVIAHSEDSGRRKAIIRSITSGFDPLEGDNKLVEMPLKRKAVEKSISKIESRKMISNRGDILCSLELSKVINVPDQKAQIEHYNELSLISHRGKSDVPKDVFKDDGKGIPFALYQDTDGENKTVYFDGSNKNLLCMPRVVIGEPGTSKTTWAQNFALHAFNKGYGSLVIDAADGKMVHRILGRVKPEQRDKVKIIDFTNTEYPVGLGWNEIYRGNKNDVTEDAVVDEIIQYIELVSGTTLNMRAGQWVEAAVKATFVTPDATLQDIEKMLNNADYRNSVIPTITDPELRSDWEYFHNKLRPDERKAIYDEAFRRLAPVMRKRTLKNFILQKPKKDFEGNYLFDLRKWMDEGYLVLVKANETLTEPIQTALVSFLLSKFNLAMISREDIDNEDDRKPCFLILDEPDHYIKGSERWRNMLTRYRKYRCGLTFLFHGWQQLVEADPNLPKIIRKAGPHYVIFQTDKDNLMELKSVIEPDFNINDIASGMPQWHAVIKLKMFSERGETIPAFMAEGLGRTEDLFEGYDNNDLYMKSAQELGRPKSAVMDDIFKNKMGSEFDVEMLMEKTSVSGEGDLDIDEEPKKKTHVEQYKKEIGNKIIEHEMSEYISEQLSKGEEVDYELIEHLEELLEEG